MISSSNDRTPPVFWKRISTAQGPIRPEVQAAKGAQHHRWPQFLTPPAEPRHWLRQYQHMAALLRGLEAVMHRNTALLTSVPTARLLSICLHMPQNPGY